MADLDFACATITNVGALICEGTTFLETSNPEWLATLGMDCGTPGAQQTTCDRPRSVGVTRAATAWARLIANSIAVSNQQTRDALEPERSSQPGPHRHGQDGDAGSFDGGRAMTI